MSTHSQYFGDHFAKRISQLPSENLWKRQVSL